MKKTGFIFLIVAVWAIAACDMSAPNPQNNYSRVEFSMDGKTALISELTQAKKEIKIAIRTIDDKDIFSNLTVLAKKGVKIKAVCDADSPPFGIPSEAKVTLGNPYGEMAANFIVIDGQTTLVLSGSELSRDRYFYLRIQDTRIASDFTNEFNQMFNQTNFGSGSDISV